MVCQTCHRLTTRSLLCDECRRELRPAGEQILPGGVRLVAAFDHSGPAKTLVHHLKYRGVVGYADLVAEVLFPRLPALPLVPVPRVWSRRLRYGIDPATVLAERLAARLAVPVLRVLSPPLHASRRAGGDHSAVVSGFAIRRPLTRQVMLIDDVVTTGATLTGAVAAVGPEWVRLTIAANAVSQVSSLRRPVPMND